jgi:Ca-activated chloride channel family protein
MVWVNGIHQKAYGSPKTHPLAATILTMSFQWPQALVLLLLLPVLGWLYWRGRKPRAESVVVFPGLETLSRTKPAGLGFRLHLPALLYGLALLLGILALARPSMTVPEGDPRAGIVLTIDVSRSMMATDIQPSRFEAARAALRTFLKEMPQGARVGLVIFSRFPTTVVPLTTNRTRLFDAVDTIDMGLGTAIGEAILEGLRNFPPLQERQDVQDPKNLATIVLLTDGRSLGGTDPIEAAQEANKEGVRIHTIGVGRVTDGPIPGLPEMYQNASQFDEPTLRAVAQATGGEYVFVDSAQKLKDTFKTLSRSVTWSTRKDEVSALPALGAGMLLGLSLLLSSARRKVM